MNPYDIDYDSLPESPIVTKKSDILKLKLTAKIKETIKNLSEVEGMNRTGLSHEKYSYMLIMHIDGIDLEELLVAASKLGIEADAISTEQKS